MEEPQIGISGKELKSEIQVSVFNGRWIPQKSLSLSISLCLGSVDGSSGMKDKRDKQAVDSISGNHGDTPGFPAVFYKLSVSVHGLLVYF